MKIKTKTKTITDKEEAKQFLRKYGLYAEFWEPEITDSNINDPLQKYKNQIAKLKRKFGYATADCCSLNTTNPNLDKILEPFKKEHHHTDDEVRFTVDGEGIFGVNPLTEPRFEVCVEKGDLLVVPAMTRHWFELTEKKNICCLRIFKENPKWEAVYEMRNPTSV
ncbi:MAG: hypothetical protein A3B68_09435 [Candidatus Melainabacteria bacterium RIFCSPHIGHO2_02_FULL_34_12]|nr:MAG: hypothetical protein A3B68_09435 [Candidatus Melainabacteria bacterium RIFCSPHIGHO2_02_FULL_34_12]